jgi:hypothetical protein
MGLTQSVMAIVIGVDKTVTPLLHKARVDRGDKELPVVNGFWTIKMLGPVSAAGSMFCMPSRLEISVFTISYRMPGHRRPASDVMSVHATLKMETIGAIRIPCAGTAIHKYAPFITAVQLIVRLSISACL